jgi:hypothetical protein
VARVVPCTDEEKRSKEFKAANEKFSFSAFSLYKIAVKAKNACHIGDHLDVHTAQRLLLGLLMHSRNMLSGKEADRCLKAIINSLA